MTYRAPSQELEHSSLLLARWALVSDTVFGRSEVSRGRQVTSCRLIREASSNHDALFMGLKKRTPPGSGGANPDEGFMRISCTPTLVRVKT